MMKVPASAGVKMATTILVVGTNEVSHHPQERGISPLEAATKQWLLETVTD
jgi:hypothetical protein